MLRAVAIAAALAGCGGGQTEPPAAAAAPPPCEAAPGWRSERIDLPPEFAPSLPAGVEHLYFAPGMFEPAAADYFSYVFSLSFEAAEPGDLEALLSEYYRGLLAAVAREKNMPFDAGSVAVRRLGSAVFEIEIVDTFVTGEPLTLRVEVATGERCLSAAASPAPPSAAIWDRLRSARAGCVACTDRIQPSR